MINYIKHDKVSVYDVVYENGVKFGELYMEVDGYYVWDNLGRLGYLPSYVLRNIIDKLDSLNEEWDKYNRENL